MNQNSVLIPDGDILVIPEEGQLALKVWLVWNDPDKEDVFFGDISDSDPSLSFDNLDGYEQEKIWDSQSTLWGNLKCGWKKAVNTATNRTIVESEIEPIRLLC